MRRLHGIALTAASAAFFISTCRDDPTDLSRLRPGSGMPGDPSLWSHETRPGKRVQRHQTGLLYACVPRRVRTYFTPTVATARNRRLHPEVGRFFNAKVMNDGSQPERRHTHLRPQALTHLTAGILTDALARASMPWMGMQHPCVITHSRSRPCGLIHLGDPSFPGHASHPFAPHHPLRGGCVH